MDIFECVMLQVMAQLDHVRYVPVAECYLVFVFSLGFSWYFGFISLFLLKMEYSVTILSSSVLVNQDFTQILLAN